MAHVLVGHLWEFTVKLRDRRRRLRRTALSWSQDSALADDLVQETLSKAFRNLGQLRTANAMDAWLFDILRNCWRDHLRRHRYTLDIDDPEVLEELSVDGDLERSEQIARVRRAIAALPVAQRETLSLVDIEGFSYDEVAEILGVPRGTVTSRICRARETLRKKLFDFDEDTKNKQQVLLRRIK
jgi:RNA polymerase sigma-70 factor (ECF subfamily)